jgi:hypothetical protein
MSKFSERYATNTQIEEDGQWVDFGEGIKVRVRRLNSKFSRDVRRKLEKPYTAMYRGREMPESLQEELMVKQLAQAIVVDWEGVEDESGKTMPFSMDNAVKIFTVYRDFRDDVVTASMERATFQTEEQKAAEGNSKSA